MDIGQNHHQQNAGSGIIMPYKLLTNTKNDNSCKFMGTRHMAKYIEIIGPVNPHLVRLKNTTSPAPCEGCRHRGCPSCSPSPPKPVPRTTNIRRRSCGRSYSATVPWHIPGRKRWWPQKMGWSLMVYLYEFEKFYVSYGWNNIIFQTSNQYYAMCL